MALDPTIPLGVRPPQASEGMNPLAMIGQFAQIQNAMNQNRLFQQTFAARQRAGQILSNAPDMEAGLAALMQDPLTAPFAGETINAIRQSQLTLTQMQGEVQGQAQKGLDAFFKTLPGVLADPSEDTWNNLVQTHLETLSPQARARVAPALDSLKKSLLDGLPESDGSPEAEARRSGAFTQRLTGLTLAGGFTPEGMHGLMGTPKTLDVGGRIQSVIERPIQQGGETVPVGQGFPKTLPPTLTQGPGGVPFLAGGDSGSANPLLPRSVAPQGANALAPQGRPPVSVPGRSGELPRDEVGEESTYLKPTKIESGKLSPLDPGPMSFTGKPLFSAIGKSPSVGQSNVIPGMRMLSPAQQRSAEKQMDLFQGDEYQQYQSMQASLAQLDRMKADMEEIAKSPSKFLQTGAFAENRLEMAKAINAIGDQLGLWDSTKPAEGQKIAPFDPNAIAAAEDFRKEATRAGMALLNQTLGAQREAASVIFSTINAVPGLNNTLLGNQLVEKSLRAASQRIVDQRQFKELWSEANQGDLTGSQVAFDKAFPAREYLDQALNSLGLAAGHGFKSPEAVKQARQSGFLTDDEATGFLLDQFPDLFKVK